MTFVGEISCFVVKLGRTDDRFCDFVFGLHLCAKCEWLQFTRPNTKISKSKMNLKKPDLEGQ